MSLYWPDTEADIELKKPRLHALLIGVGDYPHLMGGNGHSAVEHFSLQQLTTTTHTGRRIAEWLTAGLQGFRTQELNGFKNAECQLGSVELLLSPSAAVTRLDNKQVEIELANMVNIVAATNRWFHRCNKQENSIAFFYFAGHGLRAGATQYLLASDFGDPQSLNLWGNTIDFDGLRAGMKLNRASTQLFFADACREQPIDALLHLSPVGNPIITGATILHHVRTAAAFYAAAEGHKAFGPAGDVTYFASALLDAMEGAGSINRNGEWRVDMFSLGNALGHIMASLAMQHGEQITFNSDPQGVLWPIHFPNDPFVRTSIGCQSAQANTELAILLKRGSHVLQSIRGNPRPWLRRVPPGDWNIQLKFLSFPEVSRDDTLMPPVYEWEEKV